MTEKMTTSNLTNQGYKLVKNPDTYETTHVVQGMYSLEYTNILILRL